MSTRIITGLADGSKACAVFYCSTTGTAFGPLMADAEEAEAFQRWLPDDPREVASLWAWLAKFRELRPEEPGCEFSAEGLTARLFRGGVAIVTPTRASLDAPICRLRFAEEDDASGSRRVVFVGGELPPWLTLSHLASLSGASTEVL